MEQKLLQRSRENGYLDATGVKGRTLIRAHGRWCWRLRIPMVWFERRSPRSRYGSVYLEMFTTANRLSARGQRQLRQLASGAVAADGAHWEDIRISQLGDLARQIYRTATDMGNSVPRGAPPGSRSRSAGRWKTASA